MRSHSKISLTLYFALCFVVLLPNQAMAYIDASVTTLALQALIGLGVAIGAGVLVYWRKAKKKVSEKLGIDENANKITESDDVEMTKPQDKDQ